MHLSNLWYLIVALFWVGFFVLEGFDFGVGMLHSFVGKTDVERRIAVNSIGPFWDGNEVWLIVGGAAIFAAFPGWYATMFSTFYLALVVVLLALIVRGVSFEFQRKVDDPRWRAVWRWSLTIGSALIPLLLGTALGDLLHGLPIDKAHNYTGNFLRPAGSVRTVHWDHPHRGLSVPRIDLPDPQDHRRAPRPGQSSVGADRLGGRRTGLDLRDLEPPRPG